MIIPESWAQIYACNSFTIFPSFWCSNNSIARHRTKVGTLCKCEYRKYFFADIINTHFSLLNGTFSQFKHLIIFSMFC